jgi:hypothetical protein
VASKKAVKKIRATPAPASVAAEEMLAGVFPIVGLGASAVGLDRQLKVISANHSYYRDFKVTSHHQQERRCKAHLADDRECHGTWLTLECPYRTGYIRQRQAAKADVLPSAGAPAGSMPAAFRFCGVLS